MQNNNPFNNNNSSLLIPQFQNSSTMPSAGNNWGLGVAPNTPTPQNNSCLKDIATGCYEGAVMNLSHSRNVPPTPKATVVEIVKGCAIGGTVAYHASSNCDKPKPTQ